jgi:hypothetical protein
VRHFDSVFFYHLTAENPLCAFKNKLKALNLKQMLQVFMDGSDVNLKFIKDLQFSLHFDNNPNDPIFS